MLKIKPNRHVLSVLGLVIRARMLGLYPLRLKQQIKHVLTLDLDEKTSCAGQNLPPKHIRYGECRTALVMVFITRFSRCTPI